MRAMWGIRCVMLALSVAIAAVLIEHGNVVLGVLVGVLALTRAVMVVTVMRRRRALRRRFRARLGDRV